ncbi:MAG: hypothetical protein DMG14_05350 [Acidobacteria bacterium]|nr:MAG: hypothetical protein DMG14_05350 [Acidobacteriota bacterium]
MRITALVVGLVLSASGSAAAQEWIEYVNTQDGFKVNFPGQPKATETTWKSEMDYTLPARVYSADKSREHYSVTVVDYGGLEQQGIERSKSCPPGNQQCRGNNVGVVGAGYWKQDERGAIVYATFKLLQREAKLTSLNWEWQDMVEGHFIQLTNSGDQSRTFAYIGMHQHKLYIVEGTVPKGYPEPGLFQQSMGWVDKDGNGIRYQIIYSNSYHGMGVYPVPALGGAGRGGGAGARGAGAAASDPPGGRR